MNQTKHANSHLGISSEELKLKLIKYNEEFFFLVVALMLGISTATFAGEGNITASEIDKTSHNVEVNYDFNVNYNKLSEYLKLNNRNTQKVKDVHNSFCEKMLTASRTENRIERDSIINSSIDNEVLRMKNILSSKQYRKFIRVFNATLKNQGFVENAVFSE